MQEADRRTDWTVKRKQDVRKSAVCIRLLPIPFPHETLNCRRLGNESHDFVIVCCNSELRSCVQQCSNTHTWQIVHERKPNLIIFTTISCIHTTTFCTLSFSTGESLCLRVADDFLTQRCVQMKRVLRVRVRSTSTPSHNCAWGNLHAIHERWSTFQPQRLAWHRRGHFRWPQSCTLKANCSETQ